MPQSERTRRQLGEDLVGCHAVVVWSSTAGVKALLAGIPVFRCGPNFIAEHAARHGITEIETPFVGDRAQALERMAWGQWSVEEIESGLPFEWMNRETANKPQPVLE